MRRRRALRNSMRPICFALIALALVGCDRGGGQSTQAPEAPSPGPLPAATPATPAQQALLDQLPPAYRHADLENGRLHAGLCHTCHTLTKGGPDMTGPNLYGVFGRKVASRPGYGYSPALAAKDWTWDAAHLDGWLKSPRTYVPGTKMSFYGIPDDTDRRDLIAYLKVATSGGPS
jgi:cytochrome c